MRFVAIKPLSYDTWRMRLILTSLILIAAAFLPATAAAFDLEESLREQHVQYHVQYQGADRYHAAQSGGMSLSEAIESVRRRTGGKVVSAETRVQGGREVHHIKVLTKDGKVKTHKVNGRKR
jgi:uncharacterized membrane protein YkoI